MRQLLASILLPVVVCVSAAASEVNLRVMSWNIQFGNGGVTALAQEMVNSGADVIGLQEVPDSRRALIESEVERLHPTKKTWNASYAPAENGGTGNLVLTHYPLQSFSWTEIGPSSWGGNRTVSRARILVNGVSINVFSTHLDIGPGPDWGPGHRTENLTNLMSWCDTFPGARIVVGDFNSNWDSTWINTMKTKYSDTWQDVTGSPSSAPITVHNGWRADYIFRSKDSAASMRPTASWVPATSFTLSDHRAILCDIAIVSASNSVPTVASAARADGNTPHTETGTSSALTVLGADADQAESTLVYDWSATTVPTGGSVTFSGTAWTNARKNCTATFSKAGAYTLRATIRDNAGATVTSSVNVTVNQALMSITVSPASASVNTGATQQFSASAKDQFAALLATQPAFTWSVSGSGTISTSGLFTAGSTAGGPHTVTASSGGKSGTASVTVTSSSTIPAIHYLPGRIEAENYKTGGSGVGYADTSAGNSGGMYRTDDVDIENTSDIGGGHNVGYIAATEWLAYTIHVPYSGSYVLTARVASASSVVNKAMHVMVGSTNVTGSMTYSYVDGWQTWRDISATVNLTAGTHTLTVVFDTNGFNLNYIDIGRVALPGRVQAENYKGGGEGFGYHDASGGNSGGQYRADSVDIEGTTDTGGGYNVGWTADTEWLAYTIDVTTSDTYSVTARVASPYSGGKMRVLINNLNISGDMNIPATGAWQTWTSITSPTFSLSAGKYDMRIEFVVAGFNINYVDFTSTVARVAAVTPQELILSSDASATPNPANAGQAVNFAAAANGADANELNYTWNFGDGASSSGSSATHAYATAGIYTAVNITDRNGSEVSSSVTVTVNAKSSDVIDLGTFHIRDKVRITLPAPSTTKAKIKAVDRTQLPKGLRISGKRLSGKCRASGEHLFSVSFRTKDGETLKAFRLTVTE